MPQFQTVLPDASQPSLDASIEDEITVSWSDEINNGSYRLQIRATGETSWDSNAEGYGEAVLGHDTLSHTFTGMEDGEEYEARLRTETNHENGTWTTPVSAVTVLPAPNNASLDTSIEGEITITWTNNADSSDGTIEVLRSTDGSTGSSVASFSTFTTTSYTDTSLLDGEQYHYTVRRSTPHTNSDSTQVSGITVLPSVSGVSLDNSVENKITITWAKEDNNSNGNYEIYRSTDGTLGSLITTISTPSTTNYTDEGLNDGEQYHYLVRRVTNHTSKDSNQPNIITLLPAPSALSASNITGDAADLAWTNNHDYGSVTVQYRRSSAASWSDWATGLSRSTESETLTGLLDGEEYDTRVLAVTEHTTTEDT